MRKPWANYAGFSPPPPARPLDALADDERVGIIEFAGYCGCSVRAAQQMRYRSGALTWQKHEGERYPMVSGEEVKRFVPIYKAAAAKRAALHTARQAARAAYSAALAKTAPVAASAPRLHKGKTFAPITIGTTRIARLAEAADVLATGWPLEARGSASHRTAMCVARDAFLGKATPDEARVAFLEAAREAGISVRGD